LIHVLMIFVAGFRTRMRAMITGRTDHVGTAASAVRRSEARPAPEISEGVTR
jgi:hypothetical protein